MSQKPGHCTASTVISPALLGLVSLLLLVLCLGTALPAHAQKKSKAALERERQENQRRIKEAARILAETSEKRSATLGELNAINQQLGQRVQLVATINEEIGVLKQEMERITDVNTALEHDLETMRQEYAKMVYAAAKHNANSKLMFLLASESFNQFWQRLRYLRQYREARTKQVAEIKLVQQTLRDEQAALALKAKERQDLLRQEQAENAKLFALQNEQKQVVQKLTAREQDLKQEIDERRERDARLERLIADMIRREMRRAALAAREKSRREAAEARRAKAKAGGTAKPVEEEEDDEDEAEPNFITLNAEGQAMSRNFNGNKRKLMWPVDEGFVSEKYGRHPHPVIKHVMVDNLGIDIQTRRGQAVKTVFNGEVGFVANLPGAAGQIVGVMHGDYVTVYCNLSDVNVSVGQRVKAGDKLGSVAGDREGANTLKFQIWHNQAKLDPEQWLRSR